MKRSKLKSWIYCLVTASLGTYAIAVSPASDPVLDEVKQLTQDVNSVFLTKINEKKVPIEKTKYFYDIIYYKPNDNIVDLKSPQYQDLLKKFAKVKADLEQASADRQLEDLGKAKLTNMAQASKNYLEQQRRLENNFFRNLHVKGQGSVSDSSAIEKLNLQLMSNTALSLLFNDGNYQARFNLWHNENSGDLDKVEYGLSHSDKNVLEEKALSEVPTEAHYAELIQFMVIRERLTNQWGIDRLIGKKSDPTISACGTNFHSFRADSNASYYGSLWDEDRKDEFDSESDKSKKIIYPGLISLLKNTGFGKDQFVISNAELSTLLENYFNHWDEYKTAVKLQKQLEALTKNADNGTAGATPAVAAVNLSIVPDNYFQIAPKQLITAINTQWGKDADSALQVANMPADSWDAQSVAIRSAWEIYHYQRKYLIDALVNEAEGPQNSGKDQVVTPRISYVATHEDEARAVASQMVDQLLNPPGSPASRAATYQIGLRRQLEAALNSSDAKQMVAQRQSKRFNEMIGRLNPAMTRIGRADFVINNVKQVSESQRDTWRKQGMWASFIGNEDFQLSYIPYRGYLRDDVVIYTPDQLGSFFSAKLDYFSGKSMFNRWNTNGVTAVAKNIAKNELVMAGIKNFFGTLSTQFQKKCFDWKMNLSDVTEDNTPLYDVLPQALGDSYKDFLAMVAKKQPDPSDQKDTLNLYVQALSVIQLGIPLTGHANMVFDQGNSLFDAMKLGKFTSSVTHSVTSPLDVESVLDSITNKSQPAIIAQQPMKSLFPGASAPKQPFNLLTASQNANQALGQKRDPYDIKHRIVRTLMDQRIAAQVIRQDMVGANPILAIRNDASDIDSPKLADSFVNFYIPERGLSAAQRDQAVHNTMARAQQQLPALVHEACLADPHNYQDESFKNIFQDAPTYRNMIYSEDPRFKPFDDKIVKEMRSSWQKFKDAIDPWLSVIGIILLIASIYFFGPILLAGIGTLATGGVAAGSTVVGTFFGGVSAAYATAVAGATGVQAICASLLVGKASLFIGMIFLAQAVVHTEVNCFELPAQLKYQLKVAQTQIGLYIKESNTEEQIEKFAAQIHSEKVSTYVMIAMNSPTVITGVLDTVKGASELLWLKSAKALARLTTEETAELANSIREVTWKQLTDEKGVVSGTMEYVAQRTKAFVKLKQLNTLSSSATAGSLRELLSGWFVDLLKEDPAIFKDLIDARALYLDKEITRVKTLIKTNYVDDLAVAEDGSVATTSSFGGWLKSMIAKHTLRFTKYGRILIKDKVFASLKMGGFLPGRATGEKQAALTLFAYVQDLEAEKMNISNFQNIFDLLKDSGELSSADLLKQFFAALGDSDWARVESLFQWNLSESNKAWYQTVRMMKPGWFSSSKPMAKIQQAFADYRTLEGDLQNVTDRHWASNANSYFSSQAQQGSPLNTGTIVSTLSLDGGATTQRLGKGPTTLLLGEGTTTAEDVGAGSDNASGEGMIELFLPPAVFN